MPIYDYLCTDCNATYDIFHKVREVPDDVVCPSCGSKNHKRLISAPNFTLGSKAAPSCPAGVSGCPGSQDGECATGSCGLS